MAIYGQAFRQRDRMEAVAAQRAEWVARQRVAPRREGESVDEYVTRVYDHYAPIKGATQFSDSDRLAILAAVAEEPREEWGDGVILVAVDEDGPRGRLILQIVKREQRRKSVTFLTIWEREVGY